jgi:hypothetical protein
MFICEKSAFCWDTRAGIGLFVGRALAMDRGRTKTGIAIGPSPLSL